MWILWNCISFHVYPDYHDTTFNPEKFSGQIELYGHSCTLLDSTPQACKKRSGLPWWLSGKESACQCRRCGFDPWVRRIPWGRKWQPTPVLLPGKSCVQRSLWSHKELDTTEQLSTRLNRVVDRISEIKSNLGVCRRGKKLLIYDWETSVQGSIIVKMDLDGRLSAKVLYLIEILF